MVLNISIFSLLHLLAFLINGGLIHFIIHRNPGSIINRLCAISIFTISLWSLGYGFLASPISENSAALWTNISFIGGLLQPFAAIYFYLSVTQNKGAMKNKYLAIVLSLITLFFIYFQVFENQVFLPEQTFWGWICSPVNSPFYWAYLLYCEIIFITCLVIMFRLMIKTSVHREKQQSAWLFFTLAGSILTGTFTNSIFPLLNLSQMTQFGEIAFFIWGIGIVIAVTKYGLMTITARTASDIILQTMSDSLFLLDNTGKITMANNAAMLLFKKSYSELIGKGFDSLVLDTKSASSIIREVEENGYSLNNEVNFITTDNRKISLLVSVSSVKDQMKTVIGFVVVTRDITARKDMENKIVDLYAKEKRHREQLEEDAKERAIFIDVLAHELRTPLTPMLSSSSLLMDILERESSNEMDHRLINNIYQSAQIMQQRLDELLDVARYSRGAFNLDIQSCDLGELLCRITRIFEVSLHQSNQKLITDIPNDLPSGSVDPSRLEQVIANLLSNASKYSARGDNIYFRARVNDGLLKVEVIDEGVGIHEDEIVNLFKPYHRVHKDQNIPGLGLGLIVCKQIVEAHKGMIQVESTPGKGSNFSFIIPVTLKNDKVANY